MHMLAALGLVFFFSGASSLIYQVVWQRVLTLYYGVGPAWVSITVSATMLGLGAGSVLGGRLADSASSRLRSYCWIELALGVFGLVSLPLLQLLGRATAGSPPAWCFLYTFIFLLLPTILMGMTLPLLSKIGNEILPDLTKVLAKLYFWNTLGAATGSLFASFVLISLAGLDGACHVAAATNVTLALMVWKMKPRRTGFCPEPESAVAVNEPAPGWLALVACLAGFVAIGYELIWFRLVGVLVKDSPYALSCCLSVYLLGLALGSYALALPSKSTRVPLKLYLRLQFLCGLTTLLLVIAYFQLTQHSGLALLTRMSFGQGRHPNFIGAPTLGTFWSCLDIFVWPSYFMLIPTCLLGASFPLLPRLLCLRPGREGKAVGEGLLLTITGNTLGGLITGFLLLDLLGSERTLLLFGLLQTAALILLWPAGKIRGAQAWLALALVLAMLFPESGQLYLLMHRGRKQTLRGEAYFQEGRDGVVVTYVTPEQEVLNYVGGQTHGVRPEAFYYAEGIQALSLSRQPQRVLVIGYGTGSLLEAALLCRDVQKVSVVEINRSLIANLSKIPLFEPLLKHPKMELICDDARRFLMQSEGSYDAIMMDPLRTGTAYSNNLYSQEFFRVLQAHMSDGATLLVWQDEPRVIPSTLRSVFAYVQEYEKFLVCSNQPMSLSQERKNQLLQSFSQSLRSEIEEWLARCQPLQTLVPSWVNKDLKPVSEYYLGLDFYMLFYPRKSGVEPPNRHR